MPAPARARLLFALLVLAAGACRLELRATAPLPREEAPSPPPSSRIDTFVRIPLAEVAAQAEAVVPRTFSVAPYTMVLEGTADDPVVTAGYHVERSPLALSVEGEALILRTRLAYWARARRHAGPIHVDGSCGTDDEPRRHFELAVAITARLTPRFELEPTIRLRSLEATDRCEMTFAGVDVTDRVRAALVRTLDAELPALRERVRRAMDLRARATSMWSRVAEPIELDEGTFLVMHPEAVAVTQPTIEGHFLRVGLGLTARPEVVVGPRPIVPVPALPDAGAEVNAPALALHVPVRIAYEALERALAEAFHLHAGGVRYPATGRRHVTPTNVTLYGYGRAIVVRVAFTGYADGVLYLEGTPTLDPETQRLTFDDLAFTVESSSLLVRLAAFLREEDFLDDLRRRLSIDLRGPLEETRLRLTTALRRDVDGLELEGAVDTLHVLAAYVDPDDRTMHVVVRATGVVRAQYVGR